MQELIKMEKKLQKIYLLFYSLLIAQDLWQVHYLIMSIIYPKNFMGLNVYRNMMIKNVKHVELNMSIAIASYNTKDDLIEQKFVKNL